LLQLKNTSPFAVSMAAFPDARGIDTLYVVVKGTFTLGRPLRVADEQVPVQAADEPWGEPGFSSLKYASEMHVGKPSTDVVMVGQAWSTRSPKVDQLDVLLAVAERTKIVRVFGDRQWLAGVLGVSISRPVPFESTPIVYERAYGGTHKLDPEGVRVLAEERNPVGVGFRGKRKAKEAVGELLPNVEDPQRPIRSFGDEVNPQGFGFIAPAWLPRRTFAGTYDEAWQKKRAPFLPADFDPKFLNAAHPDLVFDRYLEGGELVEVINGSRSGPLKFQLPVCELDVRVRVAGKVETPPMHLETVQIEPDDERLCLQWRGEVSCDKKLLRVEGVQVGLKKLQIEGKAV
jgi:hypothetical protein